MFRARRVLLLACLFGCDKKAPPPASAAPPPGMPALEGAAADKPEHPPTGMAGQLPPGHPAMPPDHPALPPGHTDIDPGQATPAVEFDPKTVISGVLRLDDKVKSKVKEGDAVFMTARQFDPAGGKGPILAVKKLVAGKWPQPFQLDSRDAMMVGTKLSGKIVLTVTVDKDGDAITKNPGDVTGTSRPIEVPAEKIVVTLDTLL
jgi:hypothetical protein